MWFLSILGCQTPVGSVFLWIWYLFWLIFVLRSSCNFFFFLFGQEGKACLPMPPSSSWNQSPPVQGQAFSLQLVMTSSPNQGTYWQVKMRTPAMVFFSHTWCPCCRNNARDRVGVKGDDRTGSRWFWWSLGLDTIQCHHLQLPALQGAPPVPTSYLSGLTGLHTKKI